MATLTETHKTQALLHDLATLSRQYGIAFSGHLKPTLNKDGAYLLSTVDHSTAFISWCEGEKNVAKKAEGQENKSEVGDEKGGD